MGDVTTETADRLVVRSYPSAWKVMTKARLLAESAITPNDRHADLTVIGRTILDRLNTVDGLDVSMILRHGVHCKLYDDALWDWSEVEPGVIAAFNDATGLTHEVVRLPGN